MRTVGVRELKNRLSEYLRLVRAGEKVLIAYRGEVVAELRPPEAVPDDLPPGLAELVKRGLATPGKRNDPSIYHRMPRVGKPGLAQRLLDAERGDR